MKIKRIVVYCNGTVEGVQKMGINMEFEGKNGIQDFLKTLKSSDELQFFKADKIQVHLGDKAVITQA